MPTLLAVARSAQGIQHSLNTEHVAAERYFAQALDSAGDHGQSPHAVTPTEVLQERLFDDNTMSKIHETDSPRSRRMARRPL